MAVTVPTWPGALDADGRLVRVRLIVGRVDAGRRRRGGVLRDVCRRVPEVVGVRRVRRVRARRLVVHLHVEFVVVHGGGGGGGRDDVGDGEGMREVRVVHLVMVVSVLVWRRGRQQRRLQRVVVAAQTAEVGRLRRHHEGVQRRRGRVSLLEFQAGEGGGERGGEGGGERGRQGGGHVEPAGGVVHHPRRRGDGRQRRAGRVSDADGRGAGLEHVVAVRGAAVVLSAVRLALRPVSARLVTPAAQRLLLRQPHRLLLNALEALLAPQVAAVLEHVSRVGMQRPVAALARPLRRAWHLDEAVVERETVSDGVLPALLVLAVEGE